MSCGYFAAQFNEVGKKVLSGKVYDRAKHVIEECARVLSSAEALKAGEIEKFGEYLNQSHYSLRDLYEVTGDYLDALSAALESLTAASVQE